MEGNNTQFLYRKLRRIDSNIVTQVLSDYLEDNKYAVHFTEILDLLSHLGNEHAVPVLSKMLQNQNYAIIHDKIKLTLKRGEH